MQENEKCSFIDCTIIILAVVSFLIGLFAGVAITKLYYDRKSKKQDKDFNADEYIRSLNLEE